MRTGRLRTRLHIEEAAETRTSDGGVSPGWSSIGTAWAWVRGLRGRELFSAQQINPQTTHKVTMHYRGGLTSANRLVDKTSSRIFNIESVVNIDERNRVLELICTEVAGG